MNYECAVDGSGNIFVLGASSSSDLVFLNPLRNISFDNETRGSTLFSLNTQGITWKSSQNSRTTSCIHCINRNGTK